MVQFFFNALYYNFYVHSLAPSIPVPNAVESPTSISVNWMTIPDANGYIIYADDAIYIALGSTNTSIIVDRLIPGTSYSITVRAYQDILGPPSTIYNTTENGKFECVYNFLLLCLYVYS